MAADPFATQQD